jgi:hypothetical protein
MRSRPLTCTAEVKRRERLFPDPLSKKDRPMIHIHGSFLKDDQGRTLMLRGINLGGSSKLPFKPDGATHLKEGFFDHRNVSFVGRPFPLAEADEHFGRLKAWGLTFLRFIVEWESVEHAGPYMYDQEYLDYLYAIAVKAGEYGISLFIDPHSDLFSRYVGGSGAPGWVLEALGLSIPRMFESGVAVTHQLHGDPWSSAAAFTNIYRLGAGSLCTLFFAGDDFAPRTFVDGQPVQDFLQGHYCGAIQQIARRLRGLPNVVGYDTMNEPFSGYIGLPDLNSVAGSLMRVGETPTPYQGILLASGFPQEVGVWGVGAAGFEQTATSVLNPLGVRAWREGYDCWWRQNGVWDLDAAGRPCLLRPDHFAQVNGRPVDFVSDYLRPFANRYARTIREADPDAVIFLEGGIFQPMADWGPEDCQNIVYSPHWYDMYVWLNKHFDPELDLTFGEHGEMMPITGQAAIREAIARQFRGFQDDAREKLGGVPVLLGEFGIPFDFHNKEAYRTGDFSLQIGALDRCFRGVEDTLLNATMWIYTADNNNQRGDKWNNEDFSIFSRDQQTDPTDINSGGRALEAIVRPYPRAIAGRPLRLAFDYRSGSFEFEFEGDPAVTAPTEIFVPTYQYPHGYTVQLSDGIWQPGPEAQVITYRPDPAVSRHVVRLARASA